MLERRLPLALLLCASCAPAVTVRGRGFVTGTRPFHVWGFNYDHDDSPAARLIEDYWLAEWPRVERDFAAMRRLGATVVRIHLSLARFLRGPEVAAPDALARLGRLLRLAETHRLQIDLTGLASYRSGDAPWYEALDEAARWRTQARFWEEVVKVSASSPALFAYDLMNEPAVPADAQPSWWAPPFTDGRRYIEYLARAPGGRTRGEIARAWLRRMVGAIRAHDRVHPITVGIFLLGDRAQSLPIGLAPSELAREVDFLSVHLYPKEGAIDPALSVLDQLAVGVPVVVEEIGPLSCSVDTMRRFLEAARGRSSGALGFYWGRDEAWLPVFQQLAPR
jgi:hypothetical protein